MKHNLKWGNADIRPVKTREQAYRFAKKVKASGLYRNTQVLKWYGLCWVAAIKITQRSKC